MRSKAKLWSSAGGVLLLAGMVLSACGPSASTNTSNTPKKGGQIIDAISQEPSSLLPQRSTQTFADLVDAAIHASLVYTTPEFKLAPGLLTEVPSTTNGDIVVAADGKSSSYTLKLKPGLKWSDGQSLTSADIKFTYDTFMSKDYGTKNGFPASEVTSVTAPDPTTVKIDLNTVDATFPSYAYIDPIIFSPLPQHVLGSMTPAQIKSSDYGFKPTVSSGPFTVTDRVKGDHITVTANPNYYQGPDKPYLKTVIFKYFSDSTTLVNAMQANQIDTAYFLDISFYDTLKNIPNRKIVLPTQAPGGGFANYEAWYFNTKNPNGILGDVKVRTALTMAFDPGVEINQVWHGLAKPTCDDNTGTYAHDPSLIVNGVRCAYGPDGQGAKLDVAGAKAMLDGDGWTVGSDGIRVKNGQRLSLRIATTSGRKYREDSEALAQQAWKAIGVDLKVDNHPSADLFGPVLFPEKGTGDWDVAEFENSIGIDPDTHTIWNSDQTPPNGGSNLTNYSSPAVDAAEAAQMVTLDQNARTAQFKIIHAQILKDVPTFYLYSPPDLSMAPTNLHNYTPDSIGPSETPNIWDWWVG